jgi:hypothetical protein
VRVFAKLTSDVTLVLAGPDDHTHKEIKEEVPALQAA